MKPLGKLLKKVDCFAGATIMGDGGVALILDVARVGRKADVVHEREERQRPAGAGAPRRRPIPKRICCSAPPAPPRRRSAGRGQPPRGVPAILHRIRRRTARRFSIAEKSFRSSLWADCWARDDRDTAFRKDPVQAVVFRAGEPLRRPGGRQDHRYRHRRRASPGSRGRQLGLLRSDADREESHRSARPRGPGRSLRRDICPTRPIARSPARRRVTATGTDARNRKTQSNNEGSRMSAAVDSMSGVTDNRRTPTFCHFSA